MGKVSLARVDERLIHGQVFLKVQEVEQDLRSEF